MLTLDGLKQALEKDDINHVYVNRFSRIASAYGYDDANRNIIEFCSLIVDNPEVFKNTAKITSKWKSPSSISEMFRSIKTVCATPKIHVHLKDKYEDILIELDQYKKELLDELNKQNNNNNSKNITHMITDDEIKHINSATPKQKVDKQEQEKERPGIYLPTISSSSSSTNESKNTPQSTRKIDKKIRIDDKDKTDTKEEHNDVEKVKKKKKKKKNRNDEESSKEKRKSKKKNKNKIVIDSSSDTETIASIQSSLTDKINAASQSNTIHHKHNISKENYKRIMIKLIEIQNSTNSIFSILNE